MPDSSLEIIQDARQWLRAWLDAVGESPDPASRRPGELNQISLGLHQVDSAIRRATPALCATKEWKECLAEYASTLKELRARLSNFEITLRIRRAQMNGARSQINNVRSWADLAKHIG